MGGTVVGEGLPGQVGYELHIEPEVELAEVAVLEGIGEGGAGEVYFGVLPREVEDPEDLEGFEGHEADVEVKGGGEDGAVVSSGQDVLDLAGVVGEVVDEYLLVVVEGGGGQPPNLNVAVEHPRGGVLVVAVEQHYRQGVLLLAKGHYFGLEG